MIWCLSEALRDVDREHLAAAKSIVLKQDERKGFALQRFACSDNKLVRRCGISFGVHPDTGSSAVRDAVYENLKKACTRRLDPPGILKDGAPQTNFVDTKLLKHCCGIVHFYCPDGASDEQRAGRLLQGKTTITHQLNGISLI